MPFSLKNVGAKYQRNMNKVFKEQIGEKIEAYMNNMIVKSGREELHDKHLTHEF